ncbi:MAG: methylated-DNA--[protein]-cysteine S-methyltransferase [Deltaproteobacteria bacterium]|nr:methylated-DNA--[protein]-cysteine S-methyltransferase [Deltaproteobacteria bacterium]
MLKVNFYLGRFLFYSEISEYGIRSLHISRILKRISDFVIKNLSGENNDIKTNYLNTLTNEISEYLAGNKAIIEIDTDFEGYTEKEIAIYRALMNVPAGYVTTYSALAKYVLGKNANRYTGAVLSRNRLQIIVPCHRVVMKNLRIGGFTSHLGLRLKILLLQSEGITVNNNKLEGLKLYNF